MGQGRTLWVALVLALAAVTVASCAQNGTLQEVGLLGTVGEAILGDAATWSSKQWLDSVQTTVLNAVKRQYLHNDYFAGGLGLLLIGYLMTAGRRSWALVLKWLARRQLGAFTVHIQPSDIAYPWLEQWLSEHSARDSKSLNLTAKWPQSNSSEDDYYSDEENDNCSTQNKKSRPKIMLLPKLQEAHKIIFKDEVVTFQVESKATVLNKGEGSELADLFKGVGARETLVISAASREIIEGLVHEAMDAALADIEGPKYTRVLRWSPDEFYWSQVASKISRPIESVVLDVNISELVKDAKQFLSSAKWYADRGVPHRRGYLLYGPPGCGKSSTIMALAGELELGVSMIGLSAKQMSDEMLHSAMSRVDQRSILVLEDIDSAFTQRKGENASTLSFSGLLNAIDGVGAQEGRILIMTTNHLERLDPALIRPGRCDMRLYLGRASRAQAVKMFNRFYPDAPLADAEAFAQKIPEGALSPASLQGYFLCHRDSAKDALEKVDELLKAEEEKPALAPSPPTESDSAAARSSDARNSSDASTSEDSSEDDSEAERRAAAKRQKAKAKKKAREASKSSKAKVRDQEQISATSSGNVNEDVSPIDKNRNHIRLREQGESSTVADAKESLRNDTEAQRPGSNSEEAPYESSAFQTVAQAVELNVEDIRRLAPARDEAARDAEQDSEAVVLEDTVSPKDSLRTRRRPSWTHQLAAKLARKSKGS